MASASIHQFSEQCSRKINYKSECPDLMREQCIQEKFDGDKEAYRFWVRLCREHEKKEKKAVRKPRRKNKAPSGDKLIVPISNSEQSNDKPVQFSSKPFQSIGKVMPNFIKKMTPPIDHLSDSDEPETKKGKNEIDDDFFDFLFK